MGSGDPLYDRNRIAIPDRPIDDLEDEVIAGGAKWALVGLRTASVA